MSTCLLHVPAAGHTRLHHPESHRRTAGMLSFLEEHGVLRPMQRLDPRPAQPRQLTRVHSVGLIEFVRSAAARGDGMVDADTYVTKESYDAALLAAGACCAGVDWIMGGGARNGLAIVRPPGHHAERNRPGGFCLFNNVAVAARQAQAIHGLRRVLIVDYDVHHGNGTQDIFYEDENVLFVSVHLRYPYFYPGTGAMTELGAGAGRGTTLNVPFPPYVGDMGYERAHSEVIMPRAEQFRPDFILVSAGFDAHWNDPLASAGMSLRGYAQLTRQLISLAERVCDGRILFVLEGGYYLDALRHGLLNVCHALLGHDEVSDPLGPMPRPEADVTNLLTELRRLHLLI